MAEAAASVKNAPSTYGVESGRFRFDTQAGDLYVASNTASRANTIT